MSVVESDRGPVETTNSDDDRIGPGGRFFPYNVCDRCGGMLKYVKRTRVFTVFRCGRCRSKATMLRHDPEKIVEDEDDDV